MTTTAPFIAPEQPPYRAQRPRAGLRGEHHARSDPSVHVAEGQVDHPLLAPGRLHPGVHHRVHRVREEPRRPRGEERGGDRQLDRQHLQPHRLGAEHRREVRREDPVPGDRRSRSADRAPLRHDPHAELGHGRRALRLLHRSQAHDPRDDLLPLNVGRNFDEILRVVDALQTADANGVACPANWRPGEEVIVPRR